MKIYISIPISGQSIETQRLHVSDVAKELKKLGHEPVNPFDTPEAPVDLSEKEKYAYYMGRDIEQLMLCDAIFMCKGWTFSRGCTIELSVAHKMGMKIIDPYKTGYDEIRDAIDSASKFKL